MKSGACGCPMRKWGRVRRRSRLQQFENERCSERENQIRYGCQRGGERRIEKISSHTVHCSRLSDILHLQQDQGREIYPPSNLWSLLPKKHISTEWRESQQSIGTTGNASARNKAENQEGTKTKTKQEKKKTKPKHDEMARKQRGERG